MKIIKKIVLIPLLLILFGCSNEKKDTPLGWCVWEIHKHENYNCEYYGYTYQEIQDHNLQYEIDKGILYSYYITFFVEDRIGYWYCGIVCEHKTITFNDKTYYESDVIAIDCDLCYEVLI